MCAPAGPTIHLEAKEATTVVVVGADVDKFSHTFVALGGVSR
jgi:hypothetical protein